MLSRMFEEVLRDSKACGKKGIVDILNDHREDLGRKWSFERDLLLSTKGASGGGATYRDSAFIFDLFIHLEYISNLIQPYV